MFCSSLFLHFEVNSPRSLLRKPIFILPLRPFQKRRIWHPRSRHITNTINAHGRCAEQNDDLPVFGTDLMWVEGETVNPLLGRILVACLDLQRGDPRQRQNVTCIKNRIVPFCTLELYGRSGTDQVHNICGVIARTPRAEPQHTQKEQKQPNITQTRSNIHK